MSYDVSINVKVDGIICYVPIMEDYMTLPYRLGGYVREITGWDFIQGVYYIASHVLDLIENGITCTIFSKDPDLVEIHEFLVELRRKIIRYVNDYDVPLDCLYIQW